MSAFSGAALMGAGIIFVGAEIMQVVMGDKFTSMNVIKRSAIVSVSYIVSNFIISKIDFGSEYKQLRDAAIITGVTYAGLYLAGGGMSFTNSMILAIGSGLAGPFLAGLAMNTFGGVMGGGKQDTRPT